MYVWNEAVRVTETSQRELNVSRTEIQERNVFSCLPEHRGERLVARLGQSAFQEEAPISTDTGVARGGEDRGVTTCSSGSPSEAGLGDPAESRGMRRAGTYGAGVRETWSWGAVGRGKTGNIRKDACRWGVDKRWGPHIFKVNPETLRSQTSPLRGAVVPQWRFPGYLLIPTAFSEPSLHLTF